MPARRAAKLCAMFLAVMPLAPSGCGDMHSGEVGPDDDTISAPSTVPAEFSDTLVASGLSNATAMAFAPDGRLFVTEQGGRLRVIKNGALLSTPFVTVAVNASGERGLLGVAFDPQFATNHLVYVYYTATTPTVHNRLSRFTANGDVAVAGSEVVLLELDTLSTATNHNGGAIHFGPDGKLYVAVGDNANGNNAQTLANLLGKMLRLNADGTIPTDNPFVSSATGKNRAIWALGLRNPFTFAFQRGTGKLYINDVGETAWEEINQGSAGANYGWPATEGPTTNAMYTSPVFWYGHGNSATTGCAITGGAFYNPPTATFPAEYVGNYFFADYCTGWIRRLSSSGAIIGTFASNILAPVDLQVGPDGALYYLARGSGAVFKIQYSQGTPPSITQQPQSRTVAVGQSATFSVAATGSAPLAYRWQRNGSDISGATSSSYTLASATAADSGATFRAIVSNAYGTVTSASATLTVTANAAPVATITAPASGTTYAAGQTISYAGTGSDAEDGTLPASAFTWKVVFHHADHTHPFVGDTPGVTGGSFVIPTSGETSTNVFYRIHLTVRDSAGQTTTVTRDITPRVANITLATAPSGLSLTLDGQPAASGTTVASVVGMTRTLGAPSQTVGGTSYVFASWSDGGAATHAISTPASPTTYTATFSATGTAQGLRGEYHNNPDFSAFVVARVDPTVNFDWGSAEPAAGVAADTFSVRWTGTVLPQFSETYTFYTTSDDGVRLWVNDRLIVDNWTYHAATENSGTIALTAAQRANIRMEMFENSGLAVAKLAWSSPSRPKQIVPADRLAPPATAALSLAVTFVSTGKPYTVTTAAVGARLFIDRSYSITTLPAAMAGGRMVQAANDDKYVTANPHLGVRVDAPATLYVAYDPRGTTRPAWLTDGSWTQTSLSMVTTDGIGSLGRVIFRKDVSAGTLSLGGNNQPPASGAGTTYTVIAVPR